MKCCGLGRMLGHPVQPSEGREAGSGHRGGSVEPGHFLLLPGLSRSRAAWRGGGLPSGSAFPRLLRVRPRLLGGVAQPCSGKWWPCSQLGIPIAPHLLSRSQSFWFPGGFPVTLVGATPCCRVGSSLQAGVTLPIICIYLSGHLTTPDHPLTIHLHEGSTFCDISSLFIAFPHPLP